MADSVSILITLFYVRPLRRLTRHFFPFFSTSISTGFTIRMRIVRDLRLARVVRLHGRWRLAKKKYTHKGKSDVIMADVRYTRGNAENALFTRGFYRWNRCFFRFVGDHFSNFSAVVSLIKTFSYFIITVSRSMTKFGGIVKYGFQ